MSPHFLASRRALSTYIATLVLIAAALGLSLALYQGYSSSFRFTAPPVCDFGFRAVDTGLGFEQVTVEFRFDRNVTFDGLLLNGSSRGYLSLAPDGDYVPAKGGVEFFSVLLPSRGILTISNVSSSIVDGVVADSVDASAGRHSIIVVASGGYSVSSPSLNASRESGLDPLPFASPDDLSKPSSFFELMVPMEPGSTLTVAILYPGGSAEGVVYA